jgi:iron complex transport system substrate-binding protein
MTHPALRATPEPVSRASMPRRAILGGTLAGAVSAALGGCGDKAPALASPRAVVVTDQVGKRVTFARPVRRVVAIPIPAAAVVMAVDQSASHLVGMNALSWSAVHGGVMASIFPAALQVAHDIADANFAPNIESILALKPDVVIQWADKGDGLLTPLHGAGLPVLGVTYGTSADLDGWLTMFSAMLGKPERGTAMTARIDAQRQEIAQLAASRAGAGPRILYFLRYAQGMQVAGAGTFNSEYITLVGAKNAAADVAGGFGAVHIEQVLRWDPDIVLLGNFDSTLPADIYDDPVWKGVAAVRAKKVYKVPLGGYRWDPPSQETPLMWHWMSDIAFPPTAGSTLRRAIADEFSFLYGYTPTQGEIDTMLWLNANGASSGYGQFRAA